MRYCFEIAAVKADPPLPILSLGELCKKAILGLIFYLSPYYSKLFLICQYGLLRKFHFFLKYIFITRIINFL